jgi:hypothetical protein
MNGGDTSLIFKEFSDVCDDKYFPEMNSRLPE